MEGEAIKRKIPDGMAPFSQSDLEKMKIPQLKELCKTYSLHFSGSKQALVERLVAWAKEHYGSIAESPKKKQKSELMLRLKAVKGIASFKKMIQEGRVTFKKLRKQYAKDALGIDLDYSDAAMDISYDTLRFESFREELRKIQEQVSSANFWGHKFLNDELVSSVEFVNIAALNISETEITDKGLEQIGKWGRKLRLLNMRSCMKVEGPGMSFLYVNCPLLEYMDISLMALRDEHFEGIWKLPKLSCLRMSRDVVPFKITDKTLKELSRCSSLTDCRIEYVPAFTSEGLRHILRPSSNSKFNLVRFPPSLLLESGVGASSSVEELHFRDKSNFSLEKFNALIASNPNVVSVDLSGCNFIDQAILTLSKSPCAPHLKKLDASSTSGLTDFGITTLASFPNLECLDLAFSCQGEFGEPKNVSDEALVRMSQSLHNLKELKLCFCPISAANVSKLVDNLTSLKLLDLTGCGGGADFVSFGFELRDWVVGRPGLKIIHKRS